MKTMKSLLKTAAIAALFLVLTNCSEDEDMESSMLSSWDGRTYCSSAKFADKRYPGWGWENNRSCRLRSAHANIGSSKHTTADCSPGDSMAIYDNGGFAGCSSKQAIARAPQSQEARVIDSRRDTPFEGFSPISFPSDAYQRGSASAFSSSSNGEVSCVTIVNGVRREGQPVNGACHVSN